VKTILLAWVLTLPATIALSAGLFWLASKALGS
jgi:low-affinity inorganic phosphate transporter